MTDRRTLVTVLGVAALLLAGCGSSAGEPEAGPSTSTRDGSGPSTAAGTTTASTGTPASTSRQSPRPSGPAESSQRTESAEPDPVQRRMASMSLRQKVGQLLVLEFPGTQAPAALVDSLQPGGLIYFTENLVDDAQISQLSADAQAASERVGQPLLTMVDQEGGIVSRIPGTSDVPAGADFGGDAAWAERTARDTGRMLRRLGINVDLAPVADVNTVGSAGVIGSRSFSSDPGVVSRLVRAQVCGYHRGGVAAAAKHFPGHGSTTIDSHEDTARVERSEADWRATDLPPFAAAARAGVDLVMVGHLALPSIDPSGRPATISPLVNRRVIRGELGYDGVVVTDALNMGGITSWGSSAEIAVRAIKAGSDLLLMPPDPGAVEDALVDAVRQGTLSQARVDRSVERVLRLKQRLGLYGGGSRLAQC